jgi:hypothetical protein
LHVYARCKKEVSSQQLQQRGARPLVLGADEVVKSYIGPLLTIVYFYTFGSVLMFMILGRSPNEPLVGLLTFLGGSLADLLAILWMTLGCSPLLILR